MPPLPEPTEAEPGTPEKIEVMARRYADGLAILHPMDNLTCTGRRENMARLIVNGGRSPTMHRKSRAKHLRGYLDDLR